LNQQLLHQHFNGVTPILLRAAMKSGYAPMPETARHLQNRSPTVQGHNKLPSEKLCSFH
jgi:hypothetical protein